VIRVNTIQLFLSEKKKLQKNVTIKKKCSISSTDIRLNEPIIKTPFNQVLKTILELMNKIPVEEVSWKNIHQLRQKFVKLHKNPKSGDFNLNN